MRVTKIYLHIYNIPLVIIINNSSRVISEIDRDREHKRRQMPTKKPLFLGGISRRTIPPADEILHGFTERVAKKKGKKAHTGVSLSLAFRAGGEKSRIHGSTRCVLSLICTYLCIFSNKSKLAACTHTCKSSARRNLDTKLQRQIRNCYVFGRTREFPVNIFTLRYYKVIAAGNINNDENTNNSTRD